METTQGRRIGDLSPTEREAFYRALVLEPGRRYATFSAYHGSVSAEWRNADNSTDSELLIAYFGADQHRAELLAAALNAILTLA